MRNAAALASTMRLPSGQTPRAKASTPLNHGFGIGWQQLLSIDSESIEDIRERPKISNFADPPHKALHTRLLPPQHVNRLLGPFKQCRTLDNSLLLRSHDPLLEHRTHNIRLEVLLKVLILHDVSMIIRMTGRRYSHQGRSASSRRSDPLQSPILRPFERPSRTLDPEFPTNREQQLVVG
jgi:hypothetical protein